MAKKKAAPLKKQVSFQEIGFTTTQTGQLLDCIESYDNSLVSLTTPTRYIMFPEGKIFHLSELDGSTHYQQCSTSSPYYEKT